METVSIAVVIILAASSFYFLKHKPVVAIILTALGVVPLLFGSFGTSLILSTISLSLLLAQPLYVVLGVLTLVCFNYMASVPVNDFGIFPEKIFGLTDKNELLAIPFFVISGAIMTHGGIAKRLIDFARALTWWMPGGLAIAAIGGCVLFAAISGSSPVTVIAIGGMMYPALTAAGYDEKTSIGLLTSAGSLGIVIPPSIPMIIYAIVVSGQQVVDVGDLFLAGIGPGLLIGGLLGSYVVGTSLRNSKNFNADLKRLLTGFAIIASPFVVGQIIVGMGNKWGHVTGPVVLAVMACIVARKQLLEGFWALMLPVIILGGIYSGLFTPTEAAAVAVVYSLVVAIYIYNEMEWRDMPELIADSTVMMGSLVVIMVIAFVFNDYLVSESIPEQAVALIRDMELTRIEFLVVLNIFLLLVGCFMDIISAILIIAPLIVPMAAAPGIEIDPVHLGIVFIVNLEIGYLTPPLGLNLFVASTLFKKPIGEVVRSVVPFTGLMLIGIIMVTYIPAISLGPGELLQELYGTKKEPVGEIMSLQDLMLQAGEDDDEDDDDYDDDEEDSDSDDAENAGDPDAVNEDGDTPSDEAAGDGEENQEQGQAPPEGDGSPEAAPAADDAPADPGSKPIEAEAAP
jgi:C4-dicarboxylate transporter, DctM subunit